MPKQLEITYQDPNILLPNPWNPNIVDPVNQEKIQNSLKAEGFFKPVIVREFGDSFQIIAGAHRVQASISLGYDKVPVSNLGVISDGQAQRIGQIDNARYGEDDLNRLASLLSDGDMGSVEDILSVLPIEEAEMAGYMAHITLDEELAELEELEADDHDLNLDIAPTKTHRIVRFKFTIEDAEKLADSLAKIKHQQGFTESDELTNAGDALLHLLSNTNEFFKEAV